MILPNTSAADEYADSQQTQARGVSWATGTVLPLIRYKFALVSSASPWTYR